MTQADFLTTRGGVKMRVRQLCASWLQLAPLRASQFGSAIRAALGMAYISAMKIICDAKDLKVTIYGLVASNDPERVRYVGRARHPSSRFAQHLELGTVRVEGWIRDLRENQRAWPLMVEIERCRSGPAWHRELFWIREYRKRGMADLNVQSWASGRR